MSWFVWTRNMAQISSIFGQTGNMYDNGDKDNANSDDDDNKEVRKKWRRRRRKKDNC